MKLRDLVPIVVAAAGAVTAPALQETLANRILRMSETEQVAYVNSRLQAGLKLDGQNALDVLIYARSSLVLPMLEKKIEEIIKSKTPRDCFADRTVDPDLFVATAAGSIADAGNEYALNELGTLIAIDEKRFGVYVRHTFLAALNRGNPFVVAYRGLDIGDPALTRKIVEWVESELEAPPSAQPARFSEWWAEAVVDRYGHPPSRAEWFDDPIVSRLKDPLAESVYAEIIRRAFAAQLKNHGK